MVEEKLKINFPPLGGDVFDETNLQLFFSYSGAFSNTTNNLKDLSIEQFEKFIPMGYKSILLCKRIKLIGQGEIQKEFNFDYNKSYVLLTDMNYKLYVQSWKREVETTIIYKPNNIDLSANSSIWNDINECVDYARTFSKDNKCKVIVSSVLEIFNWH